MSQSPQASAETGSPFLEVAQDQPAALLYDVQKLVDRKLAENAVASNALSLLETTVQNMGGQVQKIRELPGKSEQEKTEALLQITETLMDVKSDLQHQLTVMRKNEKQNVSVILREVFPVLGYQFERATGLLEDILQFVNQWMHAKEERGAADVDMLQVR